MAWQLHYTSARSGPTGRAGFQFVAETPDLPPGMRAAVTPFLAYRPPPRAPLSPAAGELARFPVALGYDEVAGRPLLVRCRYLGQDYSGRQGNFFAHAVLAEPGELEGLRPVELWGAPHWAVHPGQGELPALDELAPGAAFDPEELADWLAASGAGGQASPYDRLAGLIDAVAAVLDRGHGRVVLVAEDAELIARWIALVSYSLPVAAAARMSFLTYSADPDAAPQRVVGTTPDVWETARHDGPVFFVDGSADGSAHSSVDSSVAGSADGSVDGLAYGRQGSRTPGRYARTAADCWRYADFTSLDAMGELTDAALRTSTKAPAGRPLSVVLDRAAALLALCQGEETVTPGEETGAAALLTGIEPPDWTWQGLSSALPGAGFELTAAIMSWARGRDPDLAGRCAARCVVLALDDPALRPALPELDLPDPARSQLTLIIVDALRAAPDLSEVARLAGLADRVGARLPHPEVEAAAAGAARCGTADLVTALAEVPAGTRETLVAGALTGLEAADSPTRAAALGDAACDLVYPERRDWSAYPTVARQVLTSVGRRRPDERLAVTRALVELDAPIDQDTTPSAIDTALREIWTRPPTVRECDLLLGSVGGAFSRSAALRELPSRVFLRLARPGESDEPGAGDGLGAAETAALAARVREVLPVAGQPADRTVADAVIVQAYAEALHATEPATAARRLDEIVTAARTETDAETGAGARAGAEAETETDAEAVRATRSLVEAVLTRVAHRLTRRTPAFRAALLAAGCERTRDRLIAQWTGGKQSRGARQELVEVAVRLRRLGAGHRPLEEWASGQVAGRLAYARLDSQLREHHDLRAELKELAAQGRRQRRGG